MLKIGFILVGIVLIVISGNFRQIMDQMHTQKAKFNFSNAQISIPFILWVSTLAIGLLLVVLGIFTIN